MRSLGFLMLAAGFLVVTASPVFSDNYIKNADFKEGSQLWRGDGRAAFLNADGTEGAETDPNVTPVLRVALSKGQRRAIYQDLQMKDAPGKLRFKVQVYASYDFKRSKRASDYQSDEYLPNADFVVRLMPDYFDRTSDLKPGQWVTVEGQWTSYTASETHAIYFIVPPGDGVVYIKSPVLTP